VDTAGTTQCTRSKGSFSRSNRQTAEVCVRLAAAAVADGIESIAIITPYAQQSRLISGLLAESAIPEGLVECRTVHRFQGNERDLVIMDTVDTRPEKPGVLLAGRKGASSAPHLLNVSISRAKGKLVIVSDVNYFRSQAAGSAIDQVLSAAVRDGERVTLSTPP
jgi:superfamily I DNA and/or RNA helicase